MVKMNAFKAKIDKTRKNSKCRLCEMSDETVSHVVKEYREGHD